MKRQPRGRINVSVHHHPPPLCRHHLRLYQSRCDAWGGYKYKGEELLGRRRAKTPLTPGGGGGASARVERGVGHQTSGTSTQVQRFLGRGTVFRNQVGAGLYLGRAAPQEQRRGFTSHSSPSNRKSTSKQINTREVQKQLVEHAAALININ